MRYQLIYNGVLALILFCASAMAKGKCRANGKKYAIGSNVALEDPCQICTCEIGGRGKPEVVCHLMSCDSLCEGRVEDDGTCCGHCVEDTCDPTKCPNLRCSKRFQFKADDTCCPQCKCRRKYMPGPVGDKCDGCNCNGTIGRIQCKKPSCPIASLECVDPVKGDDCCFHCPNGKTCALSNNFKSVIKYGEYKRVKQKICACAGEPWYPYAFCASVKVNKKNYKGTMEFLAPYMGV